MLIGNPSNKILTQMKWWGTYEVEIQQFDIFQRKDFNFFLYVVGNILQFPYFWTACHSRNVSVWKVF